MSTLRGTIHGRTIELDEEPNLPPGQQVDVTIKLASAPSTEGTGLQQAFGAWAEDADELDEFLDWNRRQRNVVRPEIDG